MRLSLAGLPLDSLVETLKPLPSFRAKQLFKWLLEGTRSFSDMTDFPLSLRTELDAKFSLYSSTVSETLTDDDDTIKIQVSLKDGKKIEAVLLTDDENRKTACLSTQVGCPMGCVFCKTGSLGFSRNLTSVEIVEQFLHLRAIAKCPSAKIPPTEISNIVIMGMGEPLLNLEELRRALLFITENNFSKRRITLSTSGIISGIHSIADNGPDIRLAVSLTAADPCLREKLMPVTKTNPLPLLKEALVHYQQKQNRRITLEVVLLRGINTQAKDAEVLAAFTKGFDAVVNIIPWNPVSGMSFEGHGLRQPSRLEVETFIQILQRRGINVTRRLKKGRGVAGACGQLGIL